MFGRAGEDKVPCPVFYMDEKVKLVPIYAIVDSRRGYKGLI